MLRLLADENFNHDLLRGLLRRLPKLDIVRVQDVGLRQMDDPAVLEWAAREHRVLLTHDVNTIPAFAFERVRQKKSMAGVFVITQDASPAAIVDDLVLLAECSEDAEWENAVAYVPLT
jgi:predicted nuclease of predicted toxin-antitoxin system